MSNLNLVDVVIDLGHGGKDPGAVGVMKEKDVVYNVAQAIKKAAIGQNIRIFFLRDGDFFVGINDRVKITNTINPRLFVSLHMNSSSGIAVGYESLIYPGSTEGRKAAEIIDKSMINAGLVNSYRGIKTRTNVGVLKCNAPAVLLELGFIKNPKDVNLITQYDRTAQAILRGIMQYLRIPYRDINKKQEVEVIGVNVKVGENKTKVDSIKHNDENYVRVRDLAELLKYDVKWDGNIILEKMMDRVRVSIDDNIINIEGLKVNNKNYVAIRPLLEILGYKVDWDNKNRIVVVNK